jgi:hypothetical protein
MNGDSSTYRGALDIKSRNRSLISCVDSALPDPKPNYFITDL